jgi:hypothetical protein
MASNDPAERAAAAPSMHSFVLRLARQTWEDFTSGREPLLLGQHSYAF